MHTVAERHDTTSDDERIRRVEDRVRVVRFIDHFFVVLYTFIGFEFAVGLFPPGDRRELAGMLEAATTPFLAPFRAFVPTIEIGGSTVFVAYFVAIAFYAAIHLVVRYVAKTASVVPPNAIG